MQELNSGWTRVVEKKFKHRHFTAWVRLRAGTCTVTAESSILVKVSRDVLPNLWATLQSSPWKVSSCERGWAGLGLGRVRVRVTCCLSSLGSCTSLARGGIVKVKGSAAPLKKINLCFISFKKEQYSKICTAKVIADIAQKHLPQTHWFFTSRRT